MNQGSQINQVNVAPPKETNKALTTDLKEMEIYELSDEKFRIMLLKKFSVQKNINRQLNEFRKTVHEQKEKYKEIETIQKKVKLIL